MIYEFYVGKDDSFGFGMGRFNHCLLIHWPELYNYELMAERKQISTDMRAWMVEQFDPDGEWAYDDHFLSTTKVYFMDQKDMMLFKLRWA